MSPIFYIYNQNLFDIELFYRISLKAAVYASQHFLFGAYLYKQSIEIYFQQLILRYQLSVVQIKVSHRHFY